MRPPAAPEGTREWFDKVTRANVQGMLGEAQEHRLLEFKTARSEFTGSDDKGNLAKALSGFANAEGGVVLWGVLATKDKDGLDTVTAIPGIDRPALMLSRLIDLTAQGASPPVPGVDHRIIKGRGGLPAVVATFVPVSDGGPHMGNLGEGRYFTRAGSSFLRMEHGQVSDMFGRRPKGVLRITAERNTIAPGGVHVRITNVGRGPVIAPFVELRVAGPFLRNQYGVDGNTTEFLPIAQRGSSVWLHAGGMDVALHPTMSLLLGGVSLGISYQGTMPPLCLINYKAGGAYMQPMEGTLEVILG